jgi:signal transduction histidine kinase
VILNLVVNALDSMEDGGRLAISLTAAGGYAELVFTDTGCGMTPDVLQNIFEPFFTKSRTGKGTGLGLFISHQIVDQHGGTIAATSAGPGTGSTFTVRIPLELAPGTQQNPGDGDGDPAPTLLMFPGSREAA